MTRFADLDSLRAACADLPAGNDDAAAAVAARQAELTKPPGSLGRLEEMAAWLARWQGQAMPVLDTVAVLVFAGNHGVTAHGGAAINQLAKLAGASLRVVPLALDRPTADFTEAPAMTEVEFLDAVATGYDAVPRDADLICLGEMGIGN